MATSVTAKLSEKIRLLLSATINHHVGKSSVRIAALVFKQPVLLSSVLITGLLLGLKHIESLQPLELMLFDRMVRLQSGVTPDPRLLVVGITEADIQAQKQFPLSDRTIAQLIAKLKQYQPRVIGLDIYRDIPHPPGHAALLQQLQADNIIVISKLTDSGGKEVPPPPGIPKERIGFNDFVLDPDGVIRRNLMYASVETDKFYSFSLQLSLNYLKKQGITLKIAPDYLQLGKKFFLPLEENSGGYQNIDSTGYQVLVNYRSSQIARQVTLTQVLEGKIDPSWVKDKIVLIGTTAPSERDVFFTPYNSSDKQTALTAGVLVHAQMVSQILSTVLNERSLFWFWPQWGEFLFISACSVVGGILAWRIQRPLWLGLTGIVALTGLFGIYFGIFTLAGWIPFVAPALAMVATGAATIASKLFHNAFYDTLTGLPNRALFIKQLQGAIAPKKRHNNLIFAVLFLDIDRFKVVNESLGHRIGDQLLVAATQRLNSCLCFADILARVGGDEFAILLENINDINQATALAEHVQEKLKLPFKFQGEEIFTSVSIGIAFYQTEDNCQSEEILRDAHTAMYRAKELGKSRYEIFATGMYTQVITRLKLESEMRQAVENQEFQVHYQPIVSLKTGKIIGFESLMRWVHPTRGFVSPGEFIPVAEETGLIIPLGQWILQESCRQLCIWQKQFPMNPPLMISVNLSPQQFSQPNLVEQIEETLKITGMDAHSLKLEITESMAMKDVESTIALLLRLKSLNLRLSIDDFGTGYSSLSYLHRFPADTLKVDRSFVMQMENGKEDAAIVQTIVMLSHNLGMDVIAEGVETKAQLEKLRELECEYGQGYFMSKPLNSQAAEALLAKDPTW